MQNLLSGTFSGSSPVAVLGTAAVSRWLPRCWSHQFCDMTKKYWHESHQYFTLQFPRAPLQHTREPLKCAQTYLWFWQRSWQRPALWFRWYESHAFSWGSPLFSPISLSRVGCDGSVRRGCSGCEHLLGWIQLPVEQSHRVGCQQLLGFP